MNKIEANVIAAATLAPFRERIAAIRPAATSTVLDDMDKVQQMMVGNLTGKVTSMSMERKLNALSRQYMKAHRATLKLIDDTEVGIREHAHAPVQLRYLNLWRFHADLVICNAFLDAWAAVERARVAP